MSENNNDALNNLIQSIQEKMGENVNSDDDKKTNENEEKISSLLNTLNSNTKSSQESSSSKKQENNESQFNSIDPSIFLKIQQIMSALKTNTPQKDLLLSLKPFLRKSRQDKMGDYLTILSVISVLETFKSKGSE